MKNCDHDETFSSEYNHRKIIAGKRKLVLRTKLKEMVEMLAFCTHVFALYLLYPSE